jgi:cardiolipin synthase
MTALLSELWPWLVALAALAVATIASAHAILHKREVRAAIGWTGLICLSPFFGALIYYVFGINRIQRRAARLASERPESGRRRADSGEARLLREAATQIPVYMQHLSRTVQRATGVPLCYGNAVEPLCNGDEAYPAMLEAIHRAERSVALASYIFDHDRAGGMFAEALADATRRGVEVRVLIDGVGARYSRPRMTRELRRRGVPVAEFLPSRLPLRNPFMNLRNHRKLLIADGKLGFAGGLNLREGCILAQPSSHPVQDLHFCIEGPVVDQLFDAFAEDWLFTTGERLRGPAWASATAVAGGVAARGIPDGPDEDFETIRWTFESALGAARSAVRLVTPYFLPEATLIAALRLAAIRGVEVDIVLPAKSNLRFVQWAQMAQLWQFLEVGCRVWLSPPPFDHSKLLVVDDDWSLVGSANWDPRSLRLNFEIAVECYDRRLAGTLARIADEKIASSRRLSLDEVDGRPVPIRLRDGIARLFQPYL